MRTMFIALIAGPLALAAALATAAPTIAAPTSSDSAVATIGLLQAQGYHVNVDRVGSAPLDRCVVTSVRNPQEQTGVVRVDQRGDHDVFIPVVVRRTITVSLDCSR